MYKNFEQMQESGGGFLKTLCEAFMRADSSNLAKLSKAFPEVARAHRASRWDKDLETPIIHPFASQELETEPLE